jgi:hypothetical protein
MMCPHNLRVYGCLHRNRGSNPFWGHWGAHHQYLLTFKSGGELIQKYAGEWGHFDTPTRVPKWVLCPHLPPHSVRSQTSGGREIK